MKERLKTLWPYAIIIAALFFLVPIIYSFLPEESIIPFVILATVNPAALAAAAIVYTIKHGFSIIFHLMAALLFVASVFVFYSAGTLPYVAYYFAVTVIFSLVIGVFRKD